MKSLDISLRVLSRLISNGPIVFPTIGIFILNSILISKIWKKIWSSIHRHNINHGFRVTKFGGKII